MIPVRQGRHQRRGTGYGHTHGAIHPHDVECATCHLEGIPIPVMAANSIPLIWTMLKGIWMMLIILWDPVMQGICTHDRVPTPCRCGLKGGSEDGMQGDAITPYPCI